MWFAGLILSLSAATVGLTVKQWINEYCNGLSGTSRDTARLRQYRLNGLIKWRVGAIVRALPLLLLLSLALFLAGLLILLWTLHPAVAGVATVLVALLFIFTVSTTILPSIGMYECPYLSPQSIALYDILTGALALFFRFAAWLTLHIVIPILSTLVRAWEEDFKSMKAEIRAHAGIKIETRKAMQQLDVHRGHTRLDADIIRTAYTTTMSAEALDAAVPCLADLPPRDVVRCLEGCYNFNERNWQAEFGRWRPRPARDLWAHAVYNWTVVDRERERGLALGHPEWLRFFASAGVSKGSSGARTEWLLSVLVRANVESGEAGLPESWPALSDILQEAYHARVPLGPSVVPCELTSSTFL